MKVYLIAAAALALAAVPASAAKMKMMTCSGDGPMKVNNMVSMMADGPQKMMMQKEMGMASMAMSKGDMRMCNMHIMNAQKAGMMKNDGQMGGMGKM